MVHLSDFANKLHIKSCKNVYKMLPTSHHPLHYQYEMQRARAIANINNQCFQFSFVKLQNLIRVLFNKPMR
jgi:hypothetical protein